MYRTLHSVAMRTINLKRKPAFLKTLDTFLAAVPWTKHRTIIIYLREHGGRRYVRLRTFNKHRTKGMWYPAPRFYMVPIDRAEDLGRAIIEASQGRPFGPQPEWWADYQAEYREWKASQPAQADQTADVARSEQP